MCNVIKYILPNNPNSSIQIITLGLFVVIHMQMICRFHYYHTSNAGKSTCRWICFWIRQKLVPTLQNKTKILIIFNFGWNVCFHVLCTRFFIHRCRQNFPEGTITKPKLGLTVRSCWIWNCTPPASKLLVLPWITAWRQADASSADGPPFHRIKWFGMCSFWPCPCFPPHTLINNSWFFGGKTCYRCFFSFNLKISNVPLSWPAITHTHTHKQTKENTHTSGHWQVFL